VNEAQTYFRIVKEVFYIPNLSFESATIG